MQLPWSILHRLPVETESGQFIGHINGVSVDSVTHGVTHYEVLPNISLSMLFHRKSLLIAPSQILSLTNEKMVVDNNVQSKEPATNSAKTRLASAPPIPSDIQVAEQLDQ